MHWAVWVILVPLAAALGAFVSGARRVHLAMLTCLGVVLAVAALAWEVAQQGPQRYAVGAWGAPIGIELHADGLSVIMLITAALVATCVSIAATGEYGSGSAAASDDHASGGEFFWPLWLFLWASLNALFLSADIFNLYVTLELVTLAAVALVALAGGRVALDAALRYLLAALLGSLVYLVAVALIYAAHATLDIASLGRTLQPSVVSAAAVALATLGLLLKTALFPFHFWLPPAHANAPAPVSAVLSGLVVTASFYLLARLWFGAFRQVAGHDAALVLGVLGTAAIVWGSVQALLAARLKVLIAYSTVAQLGYLFLLFPLALTPDARLAGWQAAGLFALSHACAKAAWFVAAGRVLAVTGHDRVRDLRGVDQRMPMTVLTFGLAGVTMMGLPPSGAFFAKWMWIDTALVTGQAWIAGVVIAGGLLAAAYTFRVIGMAFDREVTDASRVTAGRADWAALFLALAALLIGLLSGPVLHLLRIGAPAAGAGAEIPL